MKTDYYVLTHELDEKKVGQDFSQIGYIQPNPQNLSSWEFPNKSLKFTFELNDKAIKTDFLKTSAVSANGFFISEKVKTLLEKFKLMNHKYYPAVLKTKTNTNQYYWLHLCDLKIVNHIDYEKSAFHKTKFNAKKEGIQINSFKHYEELKKQNGFSFGARVEKIALLNSFPNFDIFTFLPFDNQVYISTNLKDSLIEKNITGFNVKKNSKFII